MVVPIKAGELQTGYSLALYGGTCGQGWLQEGLSQVHCGRLQRKKAGSLLTAKATESSSLSSC